MLAVMIFVNLATNVGAFTFFALSGQTQSVSRFVFYQIIGGLLGLAINLTYAGMVRSSSVETAAAIGIGLAFVMVQYSARTCCSTSVSQPGSGSASHWSSRESC